MTEYKKFTLTILFEDGTMDVSKIAIEPYEDETLVYSYLAPRLKEHKGKSIDKLTLTKNN